MQNHDGGGCVIMLLLADICFVSSVSLRHMVKLDIVFAQDVKLDVVFAQVVLCAASRTGGCVIMPLLADMGLFFCFRMSHGKA